MSDNPKYVLGKEAEFRGKKVLARIEFHVYETYVMVVFTSGLTVDLEKSEAKKLYLHRVNECGFRELKNKALIRRINKGESHDKDREAHS